MKAPERGGGQGTAVRGRVLQLAAHLMLLLAFGSLSLAVLISIGWFAPGEMPRLAPGQPPTASAPPTLALLQDVAPPAPLSAEPDALTGPSTEPGTAYPKRVGIVSGHLGNDSGAVCDDGLTEAQVNLSVAKQVVAMLEYRGYTVDLLDEFDARLAGYRADALVSIHADSCQVPGVSGFKVARVTDSAIPEAEDRLVACLYRAYEDATRLPRHPGSITDNMTNYHAFREIDPNTPGAIIEIGFLREDRNILTVHDDLVARGIVAGILCFLEQE